MLDAQLGGLFLRAGPGVAVFRDLEAQVAAQGGRLVLGADEAALLEDRDDLLAEAAPLAGMADAHVEAVEGAGGEPLLDLVGNGGRGARERGGLGCRLEACVIEQNSRPLAFSS